MGELKKVERVSATMQVVDAIKTAIQSGILKVGDKLPNESELSAELGVSRSSLREGMRILAAYGVVEIRQGNGTFVVNKFAEHVFEFLGFMPTRENIEQMAYLRQVLETGAASIIYDKLTDEQIAEMKALAEKINVNSSLSENIEADRLFHDKLISFTENNILIEVYHMMRNMIDVLMDDLMSKEEVVIAARKSHIEIANALEEKNYSRLYASISEHMGNITQYYKL